MDIYAIFFSGKVAILAMDLTFGEKVRLHLVSIDDASNGSLTVPMQLYDHRCSTDIMFRGVDDYSLCLRSSRLIDLNFRNVRSITQGDFVVTFRVDVSPAAARSGG